MARGALRRICLCLGFMGLVAACAEGPGLLPGAAGAAPDTAVADHPSPDQWRRERLRRVGARIFAAAAPFCDASRMNCRPELSLEGGEGRINAHARYGDISVSRALVDLARGDDRLALVVAHELAHLLLGHPSRSALSLAPETVRSEEREADRLGLYLAARAGYDPRAALGLWDDLLAAEPRLLGPGRGHPALPERHAAMLDTCREIEAKRDAGRPLVPGR